ncbi:group 1 glycosyl transferase [Calothrix brevissima NIES-22]|nr:group 1 glycosyl transferase [Calothrix brevissima NIES-22]
MLLTKDILVVAPTPSHPQDSGNRKRIYSLFKYLQSQSFKIHYVLYNVYNQDFYCNQSSYDEMTQEWDYFDFVLPSHDSHKVLANLRNRFLRSSSYKKLTNQGIKLPIQYSIDDWCSDNLTNFIRWKCNNFSFAAVFVEYVFLSNVIKYVPKNTLKIIDTHDVFANRHISLIENKMTASFFTTSIKEEVKGLNRSDLVLAIQEEEKEYFERHINPDVIEVSHLEEEKFITREYQYVQSVGVIASRNAINISSVKKFVEIVNKKETLKDLKIYIAGSVCQAIRQDYTNVVYLNHVDSLEKFYSIADIFVNPMLSGTGIKIKTLEAFAYGVPFLSTTSGSLGTGSIFDFHNFLTLEELVNFLETIYTEKISLTSLQEASKKCFYNYQSKLEIQLEALVNRLETWNAL